MIFLVFSSKAIMVASMDDEIPTPLPLAVRPDFRPEQVKHQKRFMIFNGISYWQI